MGGVVVGPAVCLAWDHRFGGSSTGGNLQTVCLTDPTASAEPVAGTTLKGSTTPSVASVTPGRDEHAQPRCFGTGTAKLAAKTAARLLTLG
jgi:hypothetical protein